MAMCTMKSCKDGPFDPCYQSGKKSSVSAYQKMSFRYAKYPGTTR